ncbi:tRNA uridine-5-carboxymethylaminomethyl(34) synthesis GTPase MnmE, partial [Klebsiella oxytoca]
LDLAVLLELELDFSEEDVTFADRAKLRELAADIQSMVTRMASTFSSGQALRYGIPVAIIGRTNVGKSRLLNT